MREKSRTLPILMVVARTGYLAKQFPR